MNLSSLSAAGVHAEWGSVLAHDGVRYAMGSRAASALHQVALWWFEMVGPPLRLTMAVRVE